MAPAAPPAHPLSPEDAAWCREAEALAARILDDALATTTPSERRRRRRLAALVADPASRAFLFELTDQVLRIRPRRRAAARLADVAAAHPRPAMAGRLDRAALRAGARLAPLLPGPVVALARARLRHELAALVLPAEARPLGRRLRRRRRQGMRLNVNLLGEAVVGESQAAERRRQVVALLGRPDVDCVSVKISALSSQLDVVAYDDSLAGVRATVRPVLQAAAARQPPGLVTLDMEEYRDLHLTVDAFTSLLSEADLSGLEAGIALQAYLPDSYAALTRLAEYARRRRAAGGAAIRVRLVKGANLAMERVEAELRGWAPAPSPTKAAVDAQYKRLLDLALAPENAGALRVGVASHNLFDVAWALVRDGASGGGRVQIEMLEGMAGPEARAVAAMAGGVLLYAPVVRRGELEAAVAYLVRRFEENTAPDNFLADLPSLAVGTAAWEDQRRRFRTAVAERHRHPDPPRRVATLTTKVAAPRASALGEPFANQPDTDFSLAANRAALAAAAADLAQAPPGPVPALVAGAAVTEPLTGVGIDPSHPDRPWYRYVECDVATVERAVTTARHAVRRWAATPATERCRLLWAVADQMEGQRARTVAVMAADGGKVAAEADPEVSEAVDSARYYGEQAVELAHRYGGRAAFTPRGVVVVAPPWNFPYAIPAGGTLAALAAGNAVILKPAPETVLTAAALVDQCHAAGVPTDVLQLVPCADGEVGRRLVTHPDVDAVVLTGAWATARTFLEWRPEMSLHAETSGKNAVVVTAAADQEDAVRDLVHSAFSHAGQKCSAASLAIVEAPVHDDGRFLSRLADAVASLRVGPAGDPATRVGPLIRPPSGALRRALTELGPGERWLVAPHMVGDNPHLWSPGVKLGVAPGSEFHTTECFGPVLGVMRARHLDQAIELQNATDYGLTGGISSLDGREVATWLERVAVGNAYVNRHTTGAIVRRQPFGGWKRSSIGPGAKAGGPSYVASLGTWRRMGQPDVAMELAAAERLATLMAAGEDPTGLVAERNLLRLLRLPPTALRLGATPEPGALEVSLGVAGRLGVDVELSVAPGVPGVPATARVEDDDTFLRRMLEERPARVRLVGSDPALRGALLDTGTEVDTEPLVAVGPYELARWTREQAVSRTLHRHGTVVEADGSPPATPAVAR